MKTTSLLLVFTLLFASAGIKKEASLNGAWKNNDGIMIISGQYFSFTAFTPTEFKHTYGGVIEIGKDQVELLYEFHTLTPEKVGTRDIMKFSVQDKTLKMDNIDYEQIDDGTPGVLNGSWLFANRKSDGQLGEPRSADNPRKTMKILSGTRFQWIAYNTATKDFSGTGGGTYTTNDGKYTENIDFFSRDNSRVGASLEFEFQLIDDSWHHQGLSSRGEPIYEIWERRK